jgi:hypothetical protein
VDFSQRPGLPKVSKPNFYIYYEPIFHEIRESADGLRDSTAQPASEVLSDEHFAHKSVFLPGCGGDGAVPD